MCENSMDNAVSKRRKKVSEFMDILNAKRKLHEEAEKNLAKSKSKMLAKFSQKVGVRFFFSTTKISKM